MSSYNIVKIEDSELYFYFISVLFLFFIFILFSYLGLRVVA